MVQSIVAVLAAVAIALLMTSDDDGTWHCCCPFCCRYPLAGDVRLVTMVHGFPVVLVAVVVYVYLLVM